MAIELGNYTDTEDTTDKLPTREEYFKAFQTKQQNKKISSSDATGFSGHINQFLEGAGEVFAGIPKALGNVQEAIEGVPSEETSIYKIGQDIEDFFTTDTTDPELKESFAGQVSKGLGNVVGFMLGGAAGAGVKGGTAVLSGTLGAGLGASSLYEEAREKGADRTTALSASAQGALLGLTEALPISRLFGRVLGPEKLVKFSDVLKNTAKSVGEEAVQEAMQTIGENIVANTTAGYDPDRAFMDGVINAGGVGGVTGGIAGVILNTMGLKLRKAGGQTIITTDNGVEINPYSEMGQAYIEANRAKEQAIAKGGELTKVKVINPATNEPIKSPNIARATEKLAKYKGYSEGSIGGDIYKAGLEKLEKDYIYTDKEVDPLDLVEAKQVLVEYGNKTNEELDAARADYITKQAEEKTQKKDSKDKEAPKKVTEADEDITPVVEEAQKAPESPVETVPEVAPTQGTPITEKAPMEPTEASTAALEKAAQEEQLWQEHEYNQELIKGRINEIRATEEDQVLADYLEKELEKEEALRRVGKPKEAQSALQEALTKAGLNPKIDVYNIDNYTEEELDTKIDIPIETAEGETLNASTSFREIMNITNQKRTSYKKLLGCIG